MRIRTQLEKHNRDQVRIALREGKKKHDRVRDAIHEASTMAGEMIAGINSDHKVTADDVIKTYRPEFLRKRGEI